MVRNKYHNLPQHHYSRIHSEFEGFCGTVVGQASERTNHFRYDLELKNILTEDSVRSAAGKIHLYVRKDTAVKSVFSYGDVLLIKGKIYSISPPGNPHEFDFKKYLSFQNIYGHAFVRGFEIKSIDNAPPNAVLKFAYQTQSAASAAIDKHIPESRENGIAKALLLGIKDHLDNEVKKSYSAAGAMHVLAVSGLHVGIVYLFLRVLLGRLKRTPLGRLLFTVISITAIWSYAIVTGLSPSVLRAATMFSIVAFGELISTRGNVYNSLGMAAFVLLLFDPYLIYSVGFQLSFSAVFGIVYLQPKIYRLLEIDTVILDKAWSITCVSIAAQMATFPLTAYYFHQFPTYFLVSNLVVIPSATIMLMGGIGMLVLEPVASELSRLVGFMLSKFIWFVNESVFLVESLPSSLIEWIYLDLTGLVLTYTIVIFMIWGIHHHSFKTILLGVCLFLGFLFVRLSAKREQSNSHQIIFYEVKGTMAIDHIVGHQAMLYVKEGGSDVELLSYQINPNRLAHGLIPISKSLSVMENSKQFSVQPPFTFGELSDMKILSIDTTTFHLEFEHPIATDILIIENESIKNLQWLKDHFQFDYLLIGNHNSRYYSSKMKRQAEDHNLTIHSLLEDGAYVLDVRK